MDRIVDTHCHFWWRETNSWLDSDWDVLYQDYTPVEHQAASRPVGVTRCVIVEAGDTDVDNQTIIDFAAEFDFVGGLILRADLDDPGLGHKLDEWQKLPKFRGMRMNFEAHPDPGIATKPAVIEGLRELARRGLIHDFLPLVRHLDGIATAIEQVPDLKCIIEHYGKPDFDGTLEPAWEQAMRRIARGSGAFCKLSLSPQVTRRSTSTIRRGLADRGDAPVHRPLPWEPADLGHRAPTTRACSPPTAVARRRPGGRQAVPHQRAFYDVTAVFRTG